jgi:hypothetical protein
MLEPFDLTMKSLRRNNLKKGIGNRVNHNIGGSKSGDLALERHTDSYRAKSTSSGLWASMFLYTAKFLGNFSHG